MTGILVAGALAALGFFIIPAKRRQAKEAMRKKLKTMKKQLTKSLSEHFEQEIENSLHKIQATIAPYTRFVRAEHEKNQHARQELQRLKQEIEQLRSQITPDPGS